MPRDKKYLLPLQFLLGPKLWKSVFSLQVVGGMNANIVIFLPFWRASAGTVEERLY